MMGNFFNNMYYGKGNKGDYTKNDLPTNRWQLFFSMLRLNASKMVPLNLMFLVFFLPFYLWVFQLNIPAMATLYEAGDADGAMAVLVQMVYGIAPCLLLLAPGVVGMTYVTRNMARDQNVWIWNDFWYAVKQNWKQMLGVSAINALFLILAYVGIMFYGSMASAQTFFMLPQMLMVVLSVVWILANFYMWPMMITYELRFTAVIKNSLMLAIGRLPQSIFMLLITSLFPVLFVFGTNQYLFIAILIVYVLFGFSVTGLALSTIVNGVFDKFINFRIKGARVNQGLRQEYEDEPEDIASLNEEDEDGEEEDDEDEQGAGAARPAPAGGAGK